MKNKKVLSIFLFVVLFLTAFLFPKNVFANNDTTTWCITFQLIWNDFMDKVNNGKPIVFEEGNLPIVDKLNERLYTKEDISPKSYYLVQGEISPQLKRQIEKSIKKKFNEKSDILGKIDWNAKNSYLFYTMLKKQFKFLVPFNQLKTASFNNSSEKVKYFGIKKDSPKKMYKNVQVLFYNNPDDFAVKLLTKEKEDVILYMTNSDESFEDLYKTIQKNTKASELTKNDTLTIPEINVDKLISYPELCNKKIKNSNVIITEALQTIKFKMDNKGGKLKSEAAMSVMKMSLTPQERGRHFTFNKPFVIFLKEQNKDKPYFALKIENLEYLIK